MALFGIKPSRVIAVGMVIVAGLWIGSGLLHEEAAEAPAAEAAAAGATTPRQRVGIEVAQAQEHARTIVLSCVTEADRQAVAVARVAGVVTKLNVERGSRVSAGDVVAELSDEGRSAAVQQGEARLAQATTEYNAIKRLVDRGRAPKNDLAELSASVAAAEAGLAAAKAEFDRRFVQAPVDGIVDEVPIQLGQAIQVGGEVAKVIDPDPMLAVGSVPEKQRVRLQAGQTASVRLIDGQELAGKVTFVSQAAEAATRTYRVEVEIDSQANEIADGVTCEVTVSLEPVVATSVPRSALVFSDNGELGIRAVDSGGKVAFHAVEIVEDDRQTVWVSGLEDAIRVITLGQDFVKEGDVVDAVSAGELEAAPKEPAA